MLSKIEFASGLIKDDPPLAAEGGWTDADKVRFRQGKPQTIGGWELVSTSQFTGKARGGKAWASLDGSPQMAWGTANKLYALSGGAVLDITPTNQTEGSLYDLSATRVSKTANYTIIGTDSGTLIYVPNSSAGGFTLTLTAAATLGATFVGYIRNNGTGNITLAPTATDTINGTNASITVFAGTAISVTCDGAAFTTTAQTSKGAVTTTSGSATVTITHASHGLIVGQTYNISHATAVGGLTLSGAYVIVAVLTRNTFTITAGSNASSTDTGGFLDYTVAWRTDGLEDGTGGLGYGTGTYGTGVYGLPSVQDFLPAVWSLDNFGELLLAVRRGGGLYVWHPATTYSELNDNDWALGTGWSGTTTLTKTSGTASNASQNVQGVMTPGYVYRVTFDLTISGGSLKLQMNAGTTPAVIDVGTASAPMTVAGSYSRLVVCPADPSDIVFAGDSSFAGTVSNISIKLESKAIHVPEAPEKIFSMFLDPRRIVVLLGTHEADGDFNPLLVRWSGLENFRLWIPGADNLTGESGVSKGGRLISGLPTRRQNLIWTDDAVFTMVLNSDTTGYSIDLLGTGCGLIGMNAATEHNGIAFWLSSNGNFYIFQGAIPQIIDCRIRKDVFDNIAASQGEKIFAGINSEFSEVWWFYPDARDGNECSRYAAFNWLENHWTAGTMTRTTWVSAGIFASPIAFGTDGYFYFHERGNSANGGALTAYLESSFFDVEDGENLLAIKQIIPEFLSQVGAVSFYIYTKMMPTSAETASGPHIAPATPATSAGTYLNIRRLGRQAKIKLMSSAAGIFWRLGTLRLNVDKTGAKR